MSQTESFEPSQELNNLIEKQTPHELVIGIVGAIGTDLQMVCDLLVESLRHVHYQSVVIRLAELLTDKDLKNILGDLDYKSESHRYKVLMDAGNKLRERTERGDALALLSIAAIKEFREKNGNGAVIPRQAYLLRSLKTTEEVRTLRNIYGPAFILFAAYSPEHKRIECLADKISKSEHEFQNPEAKPKATELVIRDSAELNNKWGQNVRDVFPMADFFVSADDRRECETRIIRIIELLFGKQSHSPTRDEYGMFHATGASFRSSSLQRQVGATITTNDGEVISLGMNEVPKPGGGFYWPDDDGDSRDFTLGKEINDEIKFRIVSEIINQLKEEDWLSSEKSMMRTEDLLAESLKIDGPIKGTQVMNLLEFGRCVHAEMAAIIDAARRGVNVSGSTLYVTTFPCHECARHIIAAGIQRVVYIEPYPKSMAKDLFVNSIMIENGPSDPNKRYIPFEPFIGVAPRRYMDLFIMATRKDSNGLAKPWKADIAMPNLGDYIAAAPVVVRWSENAILDIFQNQLNNADKSCKISRRVLKKVPPKKVPKLIRKSNHGTQ